jgi:hypothetical protein
MHRLSDEALTPWSDALLAPFRAEIERSSALVVLASESLHGVPVHALPWDEGILLDALSVRYGLDLETCERSGGGSAARAVVIAGSDPTFSAEIEAVSGALDEAGIPVDSVRPQAATELTPLRTKHYTIAHIVAHGSAEGEPFAPDDKLIFTEGFSLSRREILAEAASPDLVYLSACRASSADSETLGGGVIAEDRQGSARRPARAGLSGRPNSGTWRAPPAPAVA